MSLEVDRVSVQLGGAPVLRSLSLRVEAGTRTALVGPSGAGKTTLLRAIAGLAELEAGDVRLGGQSLRGIPSHRRAVTVVFQEPRLLPHLSVAENVALPLRAAKVGKGQRLMRATRLLDEVGLGGFGGRRVAGLSGGEQQRVALARALCGDPRLLLLDEPLAALDPNRREALRRLLLRLQAERELTMLLVTHDRAEAAELGQRVALLLDGRIAQEGEPEELFRRPASAAVAHFFGMANLLDGVVREGVLTCHGIGGQIAVPGADGPATVAIRPEHLVLGADGAFTARVLEAVFTGTTVRVQLEVGDVVLTAITAPGAAPAVGGTVGVVLPAEHLWRLPLEDGPR